MENLLGFAILDAKNALQTTFQGFESQQAASDHCDLINSSNVFFYSNNKPYRVVKMLFEELS